MKPSTIDELDKTNSEQKLTEFNNKKLEAALNECISEINEILSKYWHLKEEDGVAYYCNAENPIWDLEAFDEAKKLFAANGIGLIYYHRIFGFYKKINQ